MIGKRDLHIAISHPLASTQTSVALTPKMICAVCYRMLRGQDGRQWRGTFDLHFDHQTTKSGLVLSAEMGCCICRTISYELSQLYQGDTYPKDRGRFITAFLSEVPEVHEQRGLYRLDFKLSDSRRLGTFLLQQTSKYRSPPAPPPPRHSLTPGVQKMNQKLNSTLHPLETPSR